MWKDGSGGCGDASDMGLGEFFEGRGITEMKSISFPKIRNVVCVQSDLVLQDLYRHHPSRVDHIIPI